MHLTARPCCLDPLVVVEVMDLTEQLKAWAKMIAATTAIGFVVGATAALVVNRYTGHREVIAPSFANKDPVFGTIPPHKIYGLANGSVRHAPASALATPTMTAWAPHGLSGRWLTWFHQYETSSPDGKPEPRLVAPLNARPLPPCGCGERVPVMALRRVVANRGGI